MHRGSVRALRRQNASSSDVVLHVRDETGPHGVAGAPSAQARRRGCRRTSDVGRRDCSDRIKTAMRCVVAVCSCAPLRRGDQRPRCVCVCVCTRPCVFGSSIRSKRFSVTVTASRTAYALHRRAANHRVRVTGTARNAPTRTDGPPPHRADRSPHARDPPTARDRRKTQLGSHAKANA